MYFVPRWGSVRYEDTANRYTNADNGKLRNFAICNSVFFFNRAALLQYFILRKKLSSNRVFHGFPAFFFWCFQFLYNSLSLSFSSRYCYATRVLFHMCRVYSADGFDMVYSNIKTLLSVARGFARKNNYCSIRSNSSWDYRVQRNKTNSSIYNISK